MSSGFDTTDRFLRPIDVAQIRRNQNRIQAQRALAIARNVALGILAVLALFWMYRHTRSDGRFAVKAVEIDGALHTSRAEIDAVTAQYMGVNLFRIDIERVQRDLRALPWVSRIDIEKKLPDTLRIRIAERTPVALSLNGGTPRYVDENGLAFAPLSPAVGDPDLPLISGDSSAERARAAELVRHLRLRDPQVYSRLSEIRPIWPGGFALFDRDLGTVVYANGHDLSEKFRSLYAVVEAEKFPRGALQYADLRFADRIVVKPKENSGYLIRASDSAGPRIPNPASLD
jgi:cell division protein FtsQ